MCFGNTNGSVVVDATGGVAPYTFSCSSGSVSGNTISGLSAGTYTVILTDANSCVTTLSITITQPASLSLTATPAVVTQPTCNTSNNGSINITVSGGTVPYSYSWNNGIERDSPRRPTEPPIL